MAKTSDEAEGLVMARRGMRLCENIAGSLTAFVEVNLTQPVWNLGNQVNNKINHSGMVTNRHTYYYISNGDFLANPERRLRQAQPLGKNA
jgi:D-serine deaminase-like pyridoxal phosphate-dependent protein